ncbi:MAG: PLP-dependent transferase [Leptospiraceae bacterium]|nr:PLP-dependent transferase [Leptospiraceae bacterium]
MRFGTKLIHDGNGFEPGTGAINLPIFQTSTFHQKDPMVGQKYDYSRSGNPTRESFEKAIANLENGRFGFAFSSGMAATSSVLSIFSTGDHILVCEDVYGGTYRAVSTIFNRFGFEIELIDMTDPDLVRKKLRKNTRAIFMETPSNPLLKITNIREIVKIASERQILTIIDNTFLTPYYQRPLELGVDIVIHSATKFIGGHSDVVGGAVVVKDEGLSKRIYSIQNGMGSILGPQDSWLLLRGMRTLKVRLDFQENSVSQIVKFLENSDSVKKVYYPGLSDHPDREIHFSQSRGGGSVLSFELSPDHKVETFLKSIQLGAVAVSLGGVETIVSYPAKMSHASMPPEKRKELGISDELIRISVGLEEPEDLIEDLENSFQKSKVG